MYTFAEPMDDEKIEEIQKGERGTVEGFMETIKEKIRVAKAALEATATELEAAIGEDSVQESIEETIVIDAVEELEEEMIAEDAVEESEEQTIIEDAVEESEERTTAEDGMKESEELTISKTEQTGDIEAKIASNEIDADIQSDEEVDEAFLNELQEQKDEDEKKDLFAVTLSTRNFVNGVEVLRPNHLNEGDKWEVEYSIGEFSSGGRAWSVYNALRLRQKKVAHSRLTSTDPEQLGSYHQYIRLLSSQGRDWEKHQNALDAGKETIVYKSTTNN